MHRYDQRACRDRNIWTPRTQGSRADPIAGDPNDSGDPFDSGDICAVQVAVPLRVLDQLSGGGAAPATWHEELRRVKFRDGVFENW